jgi:class III poly(R)-hydroxyalkanoic acid synthase PhaE subunit
MEAYQNMYKAMVPDMNEYWSNIGDYWKNVIPGGDNNPWSAMMNNMMKMVPGMDNVMVNPFQIPGMDMYNKLFDMWKGMTDPTSFIKNFQAKYVEIVQEMFKGFLPSGSQAFFGNYQELLNTCVSYYQSVMAPWLQIDEDILKRIFAGDSTAYVDFFNAINEKYDETFAKFFNMMGMGMNREANEEQLQAVGSYIKMLFSAGTLVALVADASKDSAKALLDHYQKELKDGKAITTFRDFYNLWYRVTEDIMLELLNTDAFSKAFGDFSDKYSKFLISNNKVLERMLSPLPIPTNKDMDSLYKTVYDLRKDVRDLHRAIDSLKSTTPTK